MRVRLKAGRKKGRKKRTRTSTLDHPHKIQRLRVIPLPQMEVQELVRLGGNQRGLLVREREQEGGGAHFDFDFEGISWSSPSPSSSSSSCSTEEVRPSHLPPSPSARPHLSRNPDPSHPSPTPPSPTDTVPPTPQGPSPPCTIPYRCVNTSTRRARPRPPPCGERTLPCPSVCAAGVLYGEWVGLAGVDGRGTGLGGKRMRERMATRRARVRTDEDTSSVRVEVRELFLRPDRRGGRRGGRGCPAPVACRSWCDQM